MRDREKDRRVRAYSAESHGMIDVTECGEISLEGRDMEIVFMISDELGDSKEEVMKNISEDKIGEIVEVITNRFDMQEEHVRGLVEQYIKDPSGVWNAHLMR